METSQLIVNGLAVGSVLGLVAVGLTLTYGILRLSNFAHGDFMTLGAYLTWLANVSGVNIWLAMILGAIGTIIAMLICEQFLWKTMRDRRASSTSFIILSIGLALFLRSGILFVWGGSNQNFDLPLAQAIDIFGIKIAFYRIIAIVLVAAVMVGLHLVLTTTKVGKAMRAVADNLDLARVSGIDVEKVVLWTWLITGGLTAIGGSLYGLITTVRPNMGFFLILPMFASCILGGIGNVYGAIVGAIIIGLAQELSVPLLGSQYKLVVALAIMVVILLVRPQGLFKGTQ
jgi:neutral amino acid transport system permease protein